MKPVLKAKMGQLGKIAGAVSSDCGRMKYSGIDMAFIYVRGKRMLTMSEIARKLYPQWPRTTLYDRVKQMNLRRHTCTAREIVKVLSVNGVAKQGIHCTLVSKEDLDAFCTVYKLNPSRGTDKEKQGTVGNAETATDKKQTRTQVGPKPKNTRASHLKKLLPRRTKESGSRDRLNLNKQKPDKSGTRVVQGEGDLGHKRHVSIGINKASNNKQVHVVNTAQSQHLSPLKQLNRIRKRKHSALKTIEKATPTKANYGATKRPRKQSRVTSSPSTSDCTSLDSGISLDTQGSRSKTLNGKSSQSRQRVDKAEPRGTKRKTKSGPKLKDSKLKRDGLKMKGGKLKNHKSGVKGKSGKVKRSKMMEKETGFKKGKFSQRNKGGSITKEFIMKMDLKNMNDNDLINSFSLASSPLSTRDHTPGSEEPSYLVKLMPVKPVWRVNSSFKFISNFLLPPSLVVRDGELKPACSMVCSPGQRPPSAHPVWKWKIGEPVIGNRTEISYRIKKVKCVDLQAK